jgi:hypothetical protein
MLFLLKKLLLLRQRRHRCLHTTFRQILPAYSLKIPAVPPIWRLCRATLYACEFLTGIRPDYARKYIYMTYDDTAYTVQTDMFRRFAGGGRTAYVFRVFPDKKSP